MEKLSKYLDYWYKSKVPSGLTPSIVKELKEIYISLSMDGCASTFNKKVMKELAACGIKIRVKGIGWEARV